MLEMDTIDVCGHNAGDTQFELSTEYLPNNNSKEDTSSYSKQENTTGEFFVDHLCQIKKYLVLKVLLLLFNCL